MKMKNALLLLTTSLALVFSGCATGSGAQQKAGQSEQSGAQQDQQNDPQTGEQNQAPNAADQDAANQDASKQPGGEQARFDARLSGYEYPFEVEFFEIDAQRQQLEMAYMDVEPDEADANGETVVLMHGKNFSGAYWKSTIDALVERGYRVVVPDQIGFGKSSKPEHFQFSFHALATHTNRLLEQLGVDKASVVGHSMGGMLATRFALMFPDKVERLALVNPIGLEDWKRVVPYTTVEQWYQNELEKTPEGVKAYMTESYFDGQWKEEYAPLVELQAGWTQGPDYERVAWNSALTYDMIFTQPVLYEFGDLEMPTLLIIGARDRTALGKGLVSEEVRKTLGQYQELGKKTAEAIPNSTLVEFEGIGHIPQFEAYDRYISALTDFLEEDQEENLEEN